MKIILTSVGTRGDMEPFLVIGELLENNGHEVICAFPEQFRGLVEDSGLTFASLGTKLIQLLESDAGKAAMGGATGFKKILGTLKLAFNQKEANKELLQKQQEIIEGERPDKVLYNGKAVYPIIWTLKHKGKSIFISPLPYMHYVKGHSHVAFNSNFGAFFNKLSFSLAHFGLIVTVRQSMKWLKMNEKFSRAEILHILKNNKSIYTISPALFPRPDEWEEGLKVLGYHQRKQNAHWKPADGLVDFVNKHDKILFVTFGSMINPYPEKNTRTILDILERNGIPTIINTASGGMVQPPQYNTELLYFTTQIPYEWILPKMYAVIHHGGSGTTHLGIKHGCASMIIPHIIDQFVWNRIIADSGAGPKGITIGKITTTNLEPLILELYHNKEYKERATKLAAQMQKEQGLIDELYKEIVN